jgi:hypothetical protein
VVVLETLIKILLALVAVAFVGYPLLKLTEEPAPPVTPKGEALRERRAQLEAALQEVEFDYRTGKLPDKDYEDLTSRFKDEQAEVDAILGPSAQPAWEAGVGTVPEGRVEPGDTPEERESSICPVCEMANPPGAKFCGACGERLDAISADSLQPRKPLTPSCAACGGEVRPGDKFCGSCGAKAQGGR